jgi:hypothetical protein
MSPASQLALSVARPSTNDGRLRSEALLHVSVALLTIVAAVSSFAVSTAFGVAATFLLTLLMTNTLPASVPLIVLCAFLYQNLVVAWFTPFIPDNDAFDALRGANFVVVMTAYAVFVAATFKVQLRRITELRPWLILSIVLSATVCFYLALGVLRGDAKDAIVYFRNTITPIACFHIAIVAASLYRINLGKGLQWLAIGTIIYGYCELIFTMDFLGLFHGDLYIMRDIHRQIETGQWERTLQQTGFVLRGLQDVLTTTFFNTPLFKDIFPPVFRISGPNFHPISYAYALSIISTWLLFNGRKLAPLAALPLLLVIGSKGATFMMVTALAVRAVYRPAWAAPICLGVVVLAVTWTSAAILFGSATGDFHVLGLFAGLRDFLADPLGQGLGFGGNLSSTTENVNWEQAQATGATFVALESAVGVMLYQMGIGSLVFFGFLIALALAARRALIAPDHSDFLFAFVCIVTISANAVLQEEAFFSPLALGLCLLLVGVSFGTYWRERATAARQQSWSHAPGARTS